jgi:hypothetical protein
VIKIQSCVLWAPLFVFIFLYFVSLSPFILDLLCLVDCEFPMYVFIFFYFVSLSSFILERGSRYKIQENKHKRRNPQSTRHQESKIKGDKDTKYKNINTNRGTHSPQFRSLVSCGLWVPLFVFIFLYFLSLSSFFLGLLCLVDCEFGTHSTQDTRDLK